MTDITGQISDKYNYIITFPENNYHAKITIKGKKENSEGNDQYIIIIEGYASEEQFQDNDESCDDHEKYSNLNHKKSNWKIVSITDDENNSYAFEDKTYHSLFHLFCDLTEDANKIGNVIENEIRKKYIFGEITPPSGKFSNFGRKTKSKLKTKLKRNSRNLHKQRKSRNPKKPRNSRKV